jgi:ParB-like chromosome segregation protein Spo0J
VRRVYVLLTVILKIEEIYIPMERRKELELQRVESVAEKIMEEAEEQPILVRRDKDRYILVKGVHRLEARKALGEETIQAFIVSARRH